MQVSRQFPNFIIGATAVLFVAAPFIPRANENGPVLSAALAFAAGSPRSPDPLSITVNDALRAFRRAVRPLSHSKALEVAFRSYYAFKLAHPELVKKPYLYFVDYGLPNTKPRGYVFDMSTLEIVDGPFTVAHGRGSLGTSGVPKRFSNTPGSAATSLGLYLAQETYAFRGSAGGRRYSSIGLRLRGLSGDYNDNARRRGVVAHGAPYVTPERAGRSEGCPAMEQQRARRLLPKLAHGGMVFLFAPERSWMSADPWIVAGAGAGRGSPSARSVAASTRPSGIAR